MSVTLDHSEWARSEKLEHLILIRSQRFSVTSRVNWRVGSARRDSPVSSMAVRSFRARVPT